MKRPPLAATMKPTSSGALPGLRRARGFVVAMNAAPLDVDEPHGSLARRPDRAFAQLAQRSARRTSTPAGVDEVLMCRAHARVVRCEEQDHRSDVVRLDSCLQTLLLERARFLLRREPQLHLPRRAHRAGHDAVHADAERAQIARQPARQAFDAGFGGLIDREVRQRQVPRHRAEIDDGAGAEPPSCRR